MRTFNNLYRKLYQKLNEISYNLYLLTRKYSFVDVDKKLNLKFNGDHY